MGSKRPQEREEVKVEEKKMRFSASRVNVWCHCHARYKKVYVEHLMVKQESARPLVVGALVHRLLHQQHIGKLNVARLQNYEEIVQEQFPDINETDAISIATEAVRLFSGYITQYENDPLEVVSSEMHLEQDFGDFRLYSRIDTLYRTQDGRLWRGEHKTAARTDNAYLSGLKGGVQTGIADLLLKNAIPEKVYGTIYNLLVKTKVPQYYRVPVLTEKYLAKMTWRLLEGMYEGIMRQDFYPSGQCIVYNRQCDMLPLCKVEGTPAYEQIKEAFYTYRSDELPIDDNEED